MKTKIIKTYHDPLIFLAMIVCLLSGSVLGKYPEWVRASESLITPQVTKVTTEVQVEVVRPISCNTEKCKIFSYIVEVFKDDAANAITMLRKCENSKFDPYAKNVNKNGTCDIGVFQINTQCNSVDAVELTDWKHNVDRAYAKYKAHKNTFYLWSCAGVINQKSYKDNL